MLLRIGICLTLIFFSCSGNKTEKINAEKNSTQKSETDMNQTDQPSGKRPLQDVDPAAFCALVPFFIVHARTSFSPAVKKEINSKS